MPVPEMERRRAATQATLDRYRGKAFDWSTGITCVHLAWCQLRKMGHRPPGLPRVRSALAARRALQARGWSSVADLLDSVLPRIAPARMLLGDLAVTPSEEGMGSVMVCVGPRMLMGWREDLPELVMLDVSPAELAGAWRA